MNAADIPSTCSELPASARCDASLPDSPQCAPNYHFGMLLGVEDFRTEQGFHVGRLRRHQHLLHGTGIVAGFPVEFDPGNYQLKVGAGYGIDSLGRDLTLESSRCVNLALWWDKHQKDEAFDDVVPGETQFDLDVVVCYANCLDRPVPAIAEPCAGDAADIAYSRICETVNLNLVRHTVEAAAPAPGDYHLLRLWLGLDEPARDAKGKLQEDDQWLADEFAKLQALPIEKQNAERQSLLRELLARAVARTSPFPADIGNDESVTCLTLARLRGVKVTSDGSKGWTVQLDGSPYLGVRETMLPTHLLQTLRLVEPPPLPAPSGPAVVHDGATRNGDTVTLVFSQPLASTSIKKEAFAVSEFDTAVGWKLFGFPVDPAYDDSDPAKPSVTLTLDSTPIGKRLRITVIGTGSKPLLGANLIPAGALHPDGDGHDFTITLTI